MDRFGYVPDTCTLPLTSSTLLTIPDWKTDATPILIFQLLSGSISHFKENNNRPFELLHKSIPNKSQRMTAVTISFPIIASRNIWHEKQFTSQQCSFAVTLVPLKQVTSFQIRFSITLHFLNVVVVVALPTFLLLFWCHAMSFTTPFEMHSTRIWVTWLLCIISPCLLQTKPWKVGVRTVDGRWEIAPEDDGPGLMCKQCQASKRNELGRNCLLHVLLN